MSAFTDRRAAVAGALTAELDVHDLTVHEYRPVPFRMRHGWLSMTQTDTEDATFGEFRVLFEVIVPLSDDDVRAEKLFDEFAAPLVEALALLGRGVTVRPFTINLDASAVYCMVATLTTETEAA